MVGVDPAFVRDGPDVVEALQRLRSAGLLKRGPKIPFVERDPVSGMGASTKAWTESAMLDSTMPGISSSDTSGGRQPGSA